MKIQESLAYAKVSARQQCMYESPLARQIKARNIMLKSTPKFSGLCNFLLVININIGLSSTVLEILTDFV